MHIYYGADCCVLCSFMLNKSLIPHATENILFSLSLRLLPALMEMSDILVLFFYFIFCCCLALHILCLVCYILFLFCRNSTPPLPQTTQTHTIHVCWICLLCCCCLPEFSLSFPSVE